MLITSTTGKDAAVTEQRPGIAALLGALNRYHDHFGAPADHIPVGMPVSVRLADDSPGGNKFAAAKFAAPIGETDPRARIKLVRNSSRDARDEPAIGVLDTQVGYARDLSAFLNLFWSARYGRFWRMPPPRITWLHIWVREQTQ